MPRLRFPRSRRLTASAEFQRVRSEGSSFRGELLTFGLLRTDEPASRLGLITSKRVGQAVARNRTRRLLREIFRRHQHELIPGFWLVVIASPRAARSTAAMLEDDWLRLARRASILAP